MRRATLRGQDNLDKRYKIAAATYNLSQLMRHLFGIGTSKQAAVRVTMALKRLLITMYRQLSALLRCLRVVPLTFSRRTLPLFSQIPQGTHDPQNRLSSTGC
jgi:hypothetical protein